MMISVRLAPKLGRRHGFKLIFPGKVCLSGQSFTPSNVAVLDEAEGIEDGHLAPERFAVAACHGEIFALDVEADNWPLVIEDRRDHGTDAFATPCAGDDKVMPPLPPSLGIVLGVEFGRGQDDTLS
jgi:hypothetical protein